MARERIVEAIANWFGGNESGWRPKVLGSDAMGSAVAVGAAYYGRVRRGEGLRVKAGSARTYYIGTRAEGAAVCVLPAGTDEGTTLELNREFSVLANRPVSFNLFSSTVRHDCTGRLAELDPAEVHRHAPLVTLLRYGKKLQQMELAVRLSVSFTEVGTLELWCQSVSSPHRWRLQFELRGNAPADDTNASPLRMQRSSILPGDFRRLASSGERGNSSGVHSGGRPRRSGIAGERIGSGHWPQERVVADAFTAGVVRRIARSCRRPKVECAA